MIIYLYIYISEFLFSLFLICDNWKGRKHFLRPCFYISVTNKYGLLSHRVIDFLKNRTTENYLNSLELLNCFLTVL